MSETKPDPLHPARSLEASDKPIYGPDQKAIEVIERAAREMATRRPRHYAPDPNDIFAGADSAEPAKETAKEPTTEFSVASVEPESHVELNPAEEFESLLSMKPVIEREPAAIAAIEDHAETDGPAEAATAAATDFIDLQEIAGDQKPFEPIEPVTHATPPDHFDAATLTLPADAIAPPPSTATAPPKFVPPIRPPAPANTTPANTTPAMTAPTMTQPAARPMYDDQFHLALTAMQSVALAIAVFAFVIAAFGMAARGWVVAHDWSCRVGMAENSCPPPPPPKSLGRAEIPS